MKPIKHIICKDYDNFIDVWGNGINTFFKEITRKIYADIYDEFKLTCDEIEPGLEGDVINNCHVCNIKKIIRDLVYKQYQTITNQRELKSYGIKT